MARKKEERAGRSTNREGRKQKPANYSGNENFVSLNNQLAVLGLALREIPGDGNCLFRALGDQLEGHTRNHLQHRQDVVDYMKSNQKDFDPFMEDNVSFNTHISNLAKPGTFAGNDAIVAFARLHKVNIVIHQLNSSLWQIQGTESKNTVELHIAYHNGDHYNSVRKCGDASQTPANIRISSQSPSKAVSNKKDTKHHNQQDLISPSESSPSWQTDEVVQSIMDQTGCENEQMVKEALEDNMYDEQGTVDYLVSIQVSTGQADEGYDDLWSENGTGTRLFNASEDVTRCTHPAGGARPKLSTQDKLEQRLQQKQHMSNRQRREMNKRERKKNADDRKRQQTGRTDEEDSDVSDTFVVKDMECLSI